MRLGIRKGLACLSLVLMLPSCSGTSKAPSAPIPTVDAVLIGAGVMSATLGTFLRELEPNFSILIYERLHSVALESSAALNNAGTGHAAYCELNYTPENEDGSIDIRKALKINESFQISKQFWSYLVDRQLITDSSSFLNPVPHLSFVVGEQNVTYLRKRFEALRNYPHFQEMQYSEDPEQIKEWIPLVMEGREEGKSQPVAATRVESGADVNFGTLTENLVSHLSRTPNTQLKLRHEVRDLIRNKDGTWTVVVKDLAKDSIASVKARFVFIGAGGGSLPLLEKSGIPEAKGYGGFPVGGQWLVTTNPDLVARHHAKVYGKASVGTPPMSVPHLDSRLINGKKALLFGPFATFSTKYLKKGSWLDLPAALNRGNIAPMIQAGLDNIPLTQYLVGQLILSPQQRLAALREYFPRARMEDWKLEMAGQRVQVIKKDPNKGGVLQFGTEIVGSKDGSIISLLGASPGASTAAPIMLEILHRAYPERVRSESWKRTLERMIPSYGNRAL